MKKIKMYEFVKGFESLDGLEGFEFVLATTLNYETFKVAIEALEKAKNSNKDYKGYLEKLDGVIKDHAQKDDLGGYITGKDEYGRENYQIEPEQRSLLKKAMEELDKEYVKTIEDQKKLDKKFSDELDTEITAKIEMFNKEDLPKNIKTKQLSLVFDMVNLNSVVEKL